METKKLYMKCCCSMHCYFIHQNDVLINEMLFLLFSARTLNYLELWQWKRGQNVTIFNNLSFQTNNINKSS